MPRSLVLSLLLHGGLALVLFVWVKPFPKPNPQPLRVMLVETPKKEAPKVSRAKPLPDFKLDLRPSTTQGVLIPKKLSRLEEILSHPQGYEVTRRMGVRTGGELYGSLWALHQRIWGRLIYPEELVRFGKRGRVTVQVKVDHRGTLQGEFEVLRSDDPLLTLLTLACVRKALEQPLPKNLHLAKAPLTLVLQVHYSTFAHPTYLPQAEAPVHKNLLSFQKFLIRDPLPLRVGTPLVGDGFGVNLDLAKVGTQVREIFVREGLDPEVIHQIR